MNSGMKFFIATVTNVLRAGYCYLSTFDPKTLNTMKLYDTFVLIATVPLTVSASAGADLAERSENKEVEPNGYLSFAEYVQKYDKHWPEEEFERRRSIFNKNLQRIQDHNMNRSPGQHVLGTDQFTDMEPHEVWKGYDKSRKYEQGNPLASFTRDTVHEPTRLMGILEERLGVSLRDPIESLPSSVDWREQGVVTPVKSQGQCGSCWAFASTAVLESHLSIQTGKLTELSVQELVSCAPNTRNCGGTGGCGGSTSELAFEHVQRYGMVSEWQFGYQSYHPDGPVNCSLSPTGRFEKQEMQQTTAQYSSSHLRKTLEGVGKNTSGYYKGAVMGIGGWVALPSNDYLAVMNAVAKLGPLAVSVACHPWLGYSSGVFVGANFSEGIEQATDVNHLVVLEGYGTDPVTLQDYWLVRNSWGTNWGENGYIRLDRSSVPQCGLDVTPADGVACTNDPNGQAVVPPNATICGNSGILYDVTIPTHVFGL